MEECIIVIFWNLYTKLKSQNLKAFWNLKIKATIKRIIYLYSELSTHTKEGEREFNIAWNTKFYLQFCAGLVYFYVKLGKEK